MRGVYGDDVKYPVKLSEFDWFYRCSCETLTAGCKVQRSCDESMFAKGPCRGIPHVPLPGMIASVWLDVSPCKMATKVGHELFRSSQVAREAFVGLNVRSQSIPVEAGAPADTQTQILNHFNSIVGERERERYLYMYTY